MPFDLFGMPRGQQPFDELTQLDVYKPQEFVTQPVARPNQAAGPSKQNYDPFSDLGPYPQPPQEQPYNFLEMLAFSRPHSLLGALGKGELMKRQMQQQEYQRRLKEYEDKQQMLLQRAQYESLAAQRDAARQHYYGQPHTVVRNGQQVMVTRPEDVQPTDQPYQAPKQDMSIQPYEDLRSGDPVRMAKAREWLRLQGETRADFRQPPQPSWAFQEVEGDNGEPQLVPYNRSAATPPKLPSNKPHKTGTEKPTNRQGDINKSLDALDQKLRLQVARGEVEPSDAEAQLKAHRDQLMSRGNTEGAPSLPMAQPGTVWKRNKKTGEIGLFDERTGARIQ